MQLFGKNPSEDVIVIAEIGVNHEGKVEKASQLLHLAAEAGADAVKFQSYTPSRFISAEDPERFERVSRFALSEASHRRLADEARQLGVAFTSTPVTEDWLPLLSELSEAIKIASGDLTFEPVIREACRTGKPVIISTGCGTIEEVDQAVAWAREEIGTDLSEQVALMHCVSAYPTPVEQANLKSIPFMKERYGLHVGWSNHVIGPDACIAAVALGASMVEVHFTDQKTGRDFRDHELSFEPADLAALVNSVKNIRAALGEHGKRVAEAEAAACKAIRKGLIAARDIDAGQTLSREDIKFARPATEFDSCEIEDVIGAVAKEPVQEGFVLKRQAIQLK